MNTLQADLAHHAPPTSPPVASPPRASPPLASPLAAAPLTTDAEIEDRVLALIGTAGHRQLWLMFLDSDDGQLPVVIPLDDLPREPNRAETDVLVGHLAGILAQVRAVQLVLVWERPGRGRLTERDQAWARALAANCARRGVRLRAQLLSHTRGVTILAPEDYASSADLADCADVVDCDADAVTAVATGTGAVTPTGVSSTGGTGC